jgi:hypothetical protein
MTSKKQVKQKRVEVIKKLKKKEGRQLRQTQKLYEKQVKDDFNSLLLHLLLIQLLCLP